MAKSFRLNAVAGSALIFSSIFFADWLTKFFIISHLSLGQVVEVIPRLFNLTLVYNPGVAFGFLGDLPDFTRQVAVWFVSAIALGVIVYLMRWEAKNDVWARHALCAILAGACGNMLDRYRYDYVIDFLDFYWGNYHWPAFNVADSAICLGVTFLFLRTFFRGAGDETV